MAFNEQRDRERQQIDRREDFMNHYTNELMVAIRDGHVTNLDQLSSFNLAFSVNVTPEEQDIAGINIGQAIYNTKLRERVLENREALTEDAAQRLLLARTLLEQLIPSNDSKRDVPAQA